MAGFELKSHLDLICRHLSVACGGCNWPPCALYAAVTLFPAEPRVLPAALFECTKLRDAPSHTVADLDRFSEAWHRHDPSLFRLPT